MLSFFAFGATIFKIYVPQVLMTVKIQFNLLFFQVCCDIDSGRIGGREIERINFNTSVSILVLKYILYGKF